MFWKIENNAHKDSLEKINDFLYDFFRFAADSPNCDFDPEAYKLYNPNDAPWLIKRITKKAKNEGEKHKKMRESVDTLFSLQQSRRKAIYEAIMHDKHFFQNRHLPFSFQTALLHSNEQALLKDFFVYFYENVLRDSCFRLSCVPSPYSRKTLAQDYFQGNYRRLKQICPVCLTVTINAETEHDVEHFFPKAAFPILSLHPNNLYFACPSCNERYKGEKEPLDSPRSDVRTTFLPFADTVREQVVLEIFPTENNKCIKMSPKDTSDPFIEDKIHSFNSMFNLENRWSQKIESINMDLHDDWETEKIYDVHSAQEYLKTKLTIMKKKLDNRPEKYLEYHYYQYMHDLQQKALVSTLTQQGIEPNIL